MTHLDTPEKRARQRIDVALQAAGWQVQSRSAVNLHAGLGVAMREFQLENSDNLPAPEVIAAEIGEDLQAALEQFAEIQVDWTRDS